MNNSSLNRRLDFHGKLLDIGAIINPPMFLGYNGENDTFIPQDGISYHLLIYLAQYFNFKWRIINQKGTWGSTADPTITNNDTGLIGGIVSGEIIFGMGGIPIRLQNYNPDIRVSHNFVSTRITYMTLQAEPIEVRGTIFMPFDLAIWIMIIISMIMFIVIGYGLTKIYRSELDIHWLTISSFLQKSPRFTNNEISTNILMQVAWFAGMILIASYSGAIISALTRNHNVKNIEDIYQFQNMVENDAIRPIVTNETTLNQLFVKYRSITKLYQILTDHSHIVSSNREALLHMLAARIRRKKEHTKIHALIAPYIMLKPWQQRLGSSRFFLQDNIETGIFTDHYGMMFRADSPLIKPFNQCLRLVNERGFTDRWLKRNYHWPVNVEVLESLIAEVEAHHHGDEPITNRHLKQLKLDNLIEPFMFLIICIIFDFFILFSEIIWMYCYSSTVIEYDDMLGV